jgi:hypothetical protein
MADDFLEHFDTHLKDYSFTFDPNDQAKTEKQIRKERENVQMLMFQRGIPQQPHEYCTLASESDHLLYTVHSLGARAAICSIQNLLYYPLSVDAPFRLRGLVTYLRTLNFSNETNVIGTLQNLKDHPLFNEYISPSWDKIKAFLMMMSASGKPQSVSDDYEDYLTDDRITTVTFKGFTVVHSISSVRYGNSEMEGEFYTISATSADMFRHLLANYHYSEGA